jgi:hypothetical protein
MSQSPLILYIETNYLMGIATGRDPNIDELLSKVNERLSGEGQVQFVLPLICIMEALKVLESMQSEGNQLNRSLKNLISQIQRDKTSEQAGSWLSHLELARVANDKALEVINSRLFEAIRAFARRVELIGLDTEILEKSLERKPIGDDVADNLILHCILAHARSNQEASKVLLTGDGKHFLAYRR